MKNTSFCKRYRLLAVLFALLFGCVGMQAQNRNRTIVHKQGHWYDPAFQENHTRDENASPSDNFESKEEGTTTSDFGYGPIQKTHEYRAVIYMNPGQQKYIRVPAAMLDGINQARSVLCTYQRWYNYEDDGLFDEDFVTYYNQGVDYTTTLSNGVVGGSFINDWTERCDLHHILTVVSLNMPMNYGNQVYYLACDMSDYEDARWDGNNLIEPTLSQRLIYTIRPASEIRDEIASHNVNTRTYYENHDIHLPAKRISNNEHSLEQVVLDMQADNYFVPGENTGSPNNLQIEITDSRGQNVNSSQNGITRSDVQVGSDTRKISFQQFNDRLSDGDVYYINVYKYGENENGNRLRYNIAQFKLTFEEGTEGIRLRDVNEAVQEGESNNYYHRTNEYLESRGYRLLNQLNFDFKTVNYSDLNVSQHNPNVRYYPYPLDWDTSSYAFYCGEGDAGVYGSEQTYNYALDRSHYPQWGQYAITNGDGWRTTTDPEEATVTGNSEDFHLYVDANERPGTICELPFEAELCRSSRLFVTAYIRSLSGDADAGVMFLIRGYDDEGGHVVYTHSVGQIPVPSESIYSERNDPTYEWYQVYFEFTNPSNETYDRYTLELLNNCSRTNGGDFSIDDIRIYFSPVEVEAHTTRPVCTGTIGDNGGEVEVGINYEMLLNRTGLRDNNNSEVSHTVYFSFVDREVYRNYFADMNLDDITLEDVNKAVEDGLIHGDGIYNGQDNYGQFLFCTDYDANDGSVGWANNIGGQGDARQLTFTIPIPTNGDGTSTLQTGKSYYVLFRVGEDGDPGSDITKYGDAYAMGDVCGLRGIFTVEGPLIIRVNGGLQHSQTALACIGQEPNVDVNMYYTAADGKQVPIDAPFDWFFGTLDEFRSLHTDPIEGTGEQRSLQQALEQFRHFYPDLTSVTNNVVSQERDDEGGNWRLYQEDIDLIRTLSTDYSVDGLNPKLTLAASNDLSIRLRQEETPIVLIPIGYMDEYIPDGMEEAYSVCWEPTPMILYAQGTAPTLNVGNKDEDYSAAEGYRVKVRIGKSQYDALGSAGLPVPVRDPKLITSDGTEQDVTVTPIDGDGANNLYLVWTNDSHYDVNENEILIGTVDDFTINSSMPAGESRVVLHFTNPDFTPREGFRYYVQCQFTSNPVHTEACYGNLTIPLVFVPDYQVWTGTTSGNWNDDGNWRRAEPRELNKDESAYITNDDNGTSQGYAPLETTKIVIPSTGAVQLYDAPAVAGGRILDLVTNKGELSNPTEYIQYDLTVQKQDDDTYLADIYETNLCEQVHFDYGGEMLHSELLEYTKAWTEVRIPTKQWTLVSTPLTGVYSGDWYTKTSGDETSEYFEDISFQDNSRFKPFMTQRSWDGNARVVQNSNAGTAAISDQVVWSSTFDDVAVPYWQGKGFSIHANMGSSYSKDSVTFRFPKSDETYSGYSDQLSRDNYGRLTTDGLVGESSVYDVQIKPSLDGKYIIIGNPFVSHLSAKEFFAANSNVLESMYWIGNGDPMTGAADEDGNWWTSDGTSDALIPPYTAFYAQLKGQPSTGERTIYFNADMAVLNTATTGNATSTNGLVISAVAENGKSSALLSYKASAENGYVTTEDVQLLGEADNSVPMVYTVAGNMATSINRIKDLRQIPLGIFAADDDVTTLTFTGVAALMEPSLYDAEMNTDTPLTEGYTLTVNGASHGRYFIRAKGAGEGTTGITDVETGDGGVSVYSVAPRQVVVSSGAELLEVSVYSVGGAMLGHESVGGGRTAVTLDGIDSGVAVVRVVTADGQTTRKLVVK